MFPASRRRAVTPCLGRPATSHQCPKERDAAVLVAASGGVANPLPPVSTFKNL